jgi:biopolymer transport protein TolR
MLHRRAKHYRPHSAEEVKGDINVTPLVDVCLVLLIIFMVVTPMLQQGVSVALPETPKPNKIPENQKQLTISVKADGTVFIKEKPVLEKNLQAELAAVHEQSPDREVVLKGDKRLQYKQVRDVMRLINEAGFTRVGLVTEQIKRGEGA